MSNFSLSPPSCRILHRTITGDHDDQSDCASTGSTSDTWGRRGLALGVTWCVLPGVCYLVCVLPGLSMCVEAACAAVAPPAGAAGVVGGEATHGAETAGGEGGGRS